MEWVIFFFFHVGLFIEFLIHEEVDDKHYQGNHQEDYSESYRAGNAHMAAKFGEHG